MGVKKSLLWTNREPARIIKIQEAWGEVRYHELTSKNVQH